MPSGQDIVNTARGALGVPYVWGGNDLGKGVDCSGLVQQTFLQYGISLPRVTYDQINVGSSVSIDKLYAGDLVFFDTDRGRTGPDHVGIYIGGGKFIHAPRPGSSVKISSLSDSYYADIWMGGRRVNGVSGGGAVTPMESAGFDAPKLSSTELAETYGMSYAFFESQPELMKLLKEATKNQWDAGRFTAHLKSTKWWRTNSKTAREFQILSKTDPATAKAQISAQRAVLQQAATQMGAILTSKQLDKMAKDSLAYAWNEAQVQSVIGSYIKFSKDRTLLGQAGTAAQHISGLAYDNGISLSEQTLKNYAQYVVRGVSTMQDVEGQIRGQAAGAFPAWAEQIHAGANVRDLVSPYIQMMSTELGLPSTDITLRDPLIKNAIGRRDSKGQPSPMSLTDFQVTLREDKRWRQQTSTFDQVMSVGRQILADMGMGMR